MGVKFFHVDASLLHFESYQPICIDVGAMLCDPQTRGVKRKFDEDEDSEVNQTQQDSHPTERQSIFNISVCKLNRFRQMPDPDLLRSVLIRNTIRCIEREMERDGVKFTYSPTSSLFFPPINLNSPLSTLNGVPEGGGGGQGTSPITYDCDMYGKIMSPVILPSVMSMNMITENSYSSNNNNSCSTEYDRYLVNVDPSSGRMTPFVRTLYDRVDSGASWNEEGDRLTSLNWSSVLNFNSSASNIISGNSGVTYNGTQTSENQFDTSHNNNSNNGCFSGEPSLNHETLHTLTPLPTTNVQNQSTNTTNSVPVSGSTSPISGSASSSSSGNSEDEIFGDIDLSLYDFDLLSPLSPPSVKMAPVSAEELMRSLSSNTSDSIQSCQTSNCYKGDYFNEEREHVTPVMS